MIDHDIIREFPQQRLPPKPDTKAWRWPAAGFFRRPGGRKLLCGRGRWGTRSRQGLQLRWALTMLARVMQRLRDEYLDKSRTDLFDSLQAHLWGDADSIRNHERQWHHQKCYHQFTHGKTVLPVNTIKACLLNTATSNCFSGTSPYHCARLMP